jgi:ribonuclease HI
MDERVERILKQVRNLPNHERQVLLQRLIQEFGLSTGDQHAPSQPKLITFDMPQMEGPADYVIVFDGGSHGNPGPAYGSYQVTETASGTQDMVRLDFGQDLTNNEAEYQTLISSLEGLTDRIVSSGADPSHSTIEIRGDSALALRQVEGAWKAKDDRMRAYRNRARGLLARFRAYRLVLQSREESVNTLGH